MEVWICFGVDIGRVAAEVAIEDADESVRRGEEEIKRKQTSVRVRPKWKERKSFNRAEQMHVNCANGLHYIRLEISMQEWDANMLQWSQMYIQTYYGQQRVPTSDKCFIITKGLVAIIN